MDVYVDLLFFTDFFMDCIVLCGAKWLLMHPVNGRRLALGALIGAVGSCLGRVIPVRGAAALCLEGVLLGAGMVAAVFRPKRLLLFVKAVFAVYAMGFLTGGALTALQKLMPRAPFCLFLILAGAGSLAGVWLYNRWSVQEKMICPVRMQIEGQVISVRALVDSGNLLKLPGSGKPVVIISRNVLWEALPEKKRTQLLEIEQELERMSDYAALYAALGGEDGPLMHGWQLVCCQTVGCGRIFLPVFTVPRMVLETEKGEILRVQIPAAVTGQKEFASGRAQMIISPEWIQ